MSKASRLKGHCNRLCTISELPAHQAKTWWHFSSSWKGGLLVRMRSFLVVAFCALLMGLGLLVVLLVLGVRMLPPFADVSSPTTAATNPISPAPAPY
jgi:hypothetical protein